MFILPWSYTILKCQSRIVRWKLFFDSEQNIHNYFWRTNWKHFLVYFLTERPILLWRQGVAVFLWESTCSQPASPRKRFSSLKNCRAEVLLVSARCSCSQGLWRQGPWETRALMELHYFHQIGLAGALLWAVLKDDAQLWLENQPALLGSRNWVCKACGPGPKSPNCIRSRVVAQLEQVPRQDMLVAWWL